MDVLLNFQLFRLNTKGQIGHGERCVKAQGAETLHITTCDRQPVGPWEWDEVCIFVEYWEFITPKDYF